MHGHPRPDNLELKENKMNTPLAKMTTAEMLAEYNKLSGRSAKKFSSRAAGEKLLGEQRVKRALEAELSKPSKVKLAESVDAKDARIAKEQRAAKKNTAPAWPFADKVAKAKAAAKEEKKVTFTDQFGTVAEEAEPKARKESTSRSAGIKESWNDHKVAAERSTRTHVHVVGHGEFKSVAEAFKKLGLPLSSHIKFRMELKKAKHKKFEHGDVAYNFNTISK